MGLLGVMLNRAQGLDQEAAWAHPHNPADDDFDSHDCVRLRNRHCHAPQSRTLPGTYTINDHKYCWCSAALVTRRPRCPVRLRSWIQPQPMGLLGVMLNRAHGLDPEAA
jgi:hypothetical protein